MRRNTLVRNSELKKNSHPKSTAYRSLRMESLEKRELLSAAPADNFSVLDADGKTTQAGWLVYTVVENETANRNTSIMVNGVQLGGDGGVGSTRVPINEGDALPGVNGSEGTSSQTDTGVLQTIRLEDWTDADYNDLVVEVTFEPFSTGTQDPPACKPCSDTCAIPSTGATSADPTGNLARPEDSAFVPIRVESRFPTIVQRSASQPQTMTAVLQMGNQTKTVFYDTSAFDSSEVFAVGMNLDTSNFASGRYEWTMTLTYDYGDDVTQTQTFSGFENVVNRSASPYGNGMNVAGLSSLNLTNFNAATERGINWERSCGKQVWFAFDGTDFTPQAGESSNSSLFQNLDGSFTLEDQGETFLFSASGKLLTRTDNLTSAVTNWTYNADGTAATKTDGANRVTTYGYANGKLSTVTDFAGRTTSYSYDSLGRITSVTEPDPDGGGILASPVTTYTYDGASSRIATVTDASGNVTAYTYSEGQVVSKTVNGIVQSTQNPFALSAVIDLSETGYDADHPAVLPQALETTGENTNIAGNTTQYRYDANGNVVWQKTSGGMETFFVYDTNGRLRKETQSVMVNGRAQGRSTEYGYDTHGNLIKIKYSDGSTEQWTYDATFDQMLSYTDQLGNRTLYTLDSVTGLTTAERHVVGQIDSAENGETDDVVTTYTYNTNRKLTSVTDALGVTTSYTYDSRGNLLTESTGGAVTTYTYDTADRRTSVTNALSQTTTYTYDNLDRLVSTTYASGQSSQNIYNNAGQLVQSIDLNGAITSYTYNTSGKVATITSPGSNVAYTYDSLGRISTETDSLNRVTTYTYNAGGKLASTTISDGTQSAVISQTTYDAWGRTATQTDAAGVVLAYTYDKFDRVTKITRTNDNVVLETQTYDEAGNLKTVKDSSGALIYYTYDSLGDVTQIKYVDNSTTRYTYDKMGRVLTQTDALGNATSYTYDTWGNLTSTTDALGSTVSYVYNAIGQTVSATDALNNITTYTYDTLGRTTSTTLTSADGMQSTTQSTAYSTQILDGVKYQIVTTTDALNNVTTSTYDLAGRLVKTTAADNSVTTYTYDTESQLLTTTDALNRVTSCTYDLIGNIATTTDTSGNIARYNYNAAGQLLSQTDPLGTITLYTYDLNEQVTQTEFRDKNLPEALETRLDTAQTFDGVDDSVTIPNTDSLNFTGEITLSAWVKVESATGFRGIVEHGFYSGREVYLRIANGKYQAGSNNGTDHYAEATVDSADIGTWVHLVGTYDGTNWNLYKNGELVSSTVSAVGAITVDCDWLIGASQYPGRFFKGKIREAGIWNTALTAAEAATLYEEGFSDVTVQSTATYDTAGNLLTQTDGMGNTTSYTYDNMGRVATMMDALNNVTTYTYDKLGRLLTTTDARGTVTRNIYDTVGNLLETRQYDGTILPTPVNSWLSDGQDFDGTSDSVNLGNDSSLNFEGEITVSAWVKIDTTGGFKAILAHGSAGGKEVYLRLKDSSYQFGSWDSVTDNHLVSAYIPAADIGTWVHLTGTYDGENWNLYRNGELFASRADSVGCVAVGADWRIGSNKGTDRFFDGEIRNVTLWNTSLDATQAAALYDASVTLTPSEDPEIAATVTPTTPASTLFSDNYTTIVTDYTYDASGHLLSLTDSVGNTTSYVYNYMGLVASETNENLDTRYFSYDSLGRLTSKTDRNERVTTYTYDAAGRLTSENWHSSGNTALKTFTYTYDSVGNLLTAGDGTSGYTYTYDNLNRNLTTTFTFDTQTAAFAYTYDAAGRQTQSALTLNNVASRTNSTTYDYLGRATSIRQTGSAVDEIFAEFEHNANGLLTSVNRYEVDDNDVVTSVAESLYTYNANNAITSITHKKPDATPIVQHSYTYDETNNIVEYLNSLDGSTSYDYDFLGQLIGADYANQNLNDELYSYDENGNRVLANGDNYTTGTNNELTSDSKWTYAYDDEGNRISKTNSTHRELYEWDYRNRLTKVTQQEYNLTTEEWQDVQIVEYTYDYNNVWIRKVVGSNSTIFIPENYQTVLQIDDNTITHHYLWTPQQQDKLLADTTTDSVLWTLTDHLGTIRDIIQQTSSGLITQAHIIYDAYGNVISCKDSTGQTIDNPVLFGYTGKAFDTSTQLQNNINRWYDVATGRWLSTDPIGFNGNDTNLYRYAANMVMCHYDTKGLGERFNEGGYLIDIHRADADTIIDPHGHIKQGKGDIRPGYKVDINTGKIFDSKNKPVIKGGYQLHLPQKVYERLLEKVAKARKAGRLGCYITIIVFLPEVVQAAESGGVPAVGNHLINTGNEILQDAAISAAAGTVVVGATVATGSTLTTVAGGSVIATGVTTVSGGSIAAAGSVAGAATVSAVGGAAVAAGAGGFAIGTAIANTKPGKVVTNGLASAMLTVCPWCFGL